jgi:hypothetical protein
LQVNTTINPLAVSKFDKETILPSIFSRLKSVATSPISYPGEAVGAENPTIKKNTKKDEIIFKVFMGGVI